MPGCFGAPMAQGYARAVAWAATRLELPHAADPARSLDQSLVDPPSQALAHRGLAALPGAVVRVDRAAEARAGRHPQLVAVVGHAALPGLSGVLPAGAAEDQAAAVAPLALARGPG